VIVIVMGVAGSGKTTIGTMLADALQCRFLDGDTLHTPANIRKMSRGTALTDEDRAPWLAAIHAHVANAAARGESLVVACSALKRAYRSVLAGQVPVTWVHLKGAEPLIRSRLQARRGHFVASELLTSQLDTLEAPESAIEADIAQPPAAIVRDILAQLRVQRED
jgi:carbohydrate kinase (thermoresistant glucokinase family)